MSGMFLWSGLWFIVGGPLLGLISPFPLVGSIIMLIGVILLILGR